MGQREPGEWFLCLLQQDGSSVVEPTVVTTWLEKFCKGVFEEEDGVVFTTKCNFCLFSLAGVAHKTVNCPTLASFNKIRKNGNLLPLQIGHNQIITATKMIPLTLEGMKKQFESEMQDLKAKLGESPPMEWRLL